MTDSVSMRTFLHHALRHGHFLRPVAAPLALCGTCHPWPCCGATGPGHGPGCDGDWRRRFLANSLNNGVGDLILGETVLDGTQVLGIGAPSSLRDGQHHG